MEPSSQLPSTSAQPQATTIQIEIIAKDNDPRYDCLQRFQPKHPVRPNHIALTVFVVVLGVVAAAGVILLIVLMSKAGKNSFGQYGHRVIVKS